MAPECAAGRTVLSGRNCIRGARGVAVLHDQSRAVVVDRHRSRRMGVSDLDTRLVGNCSRLLQSQPGIRRIVIVNSKVVIVAVLLAAPSVRTVYMRNFPRTVSHAAYPYWDYPAVRVFHSHMNGQRGRSSGPGVAVTVTTVLRTRAWPSPAGFRSCQNDTQRVYGRRVTRDLSVSAAMMQVWGRLRTT
ncbi:hypothetical protein BKP42_52680 [Rhodococcus erythropolis]|nr:hypothetical protein BKP42_52680 [Rhodococcus erythropolis]